MKLFVLLLAVVASVHALTPEQKDAIQTSNIAHIEKLDAKPRQCVDKFLKDLSLKEIVIQLNQAIKGGHSVMYKVLAGDANAIKAIAQKHKLDIVPSRVCHNGGKCGRLLLPGGNIVEANEVPGKRQNRAGMPKTGNPGGVKPTKKETRKAEKKVTTAKGSKHGKFTQQVHDAKRTANGKVKLSAAHKQWYYDNNVAETSKLNAKAIPYVKKFLEDLKAGSPSTVLHFMSPVRDGHAIRFTLVEGSKTSIKKYATKCGMKLDGDTLVAPGGKVVEAEANAEAHNGHLIAGHPEQNTAGFPEKVKVAKNRKIVKKLKQKWIVPSSFVEDEMAKHSDDSDALLNVPTHSDDSDALIAVPKSDDSDALITEF